MSFSWLAVWQGLPLLLHGAVLTIIISVTAMVLAIVIGLVAAVASQVPHRLPKALVRVYVEMFRNTPLLIQLFILYFGLPRIGITLSPIVAAISGLALYTAAYNVEVFRAGLEAVPKGQHEAAQATGLTSLQEARYIIVPQAVRISFPALGNNLVALVKNSSLVSAIGMAELMFSANEIAFTTFRSFEAYGGAVVLYVIIILILTRLLNLIEARLLPQR